MTIKLNQIVLAILILIFMLSIHQINKKEYFQETTELSNESELLNIQQNNLKIGSTTITSDGEIITGSNTVISSKNKSIKIGSTIINSYGITSDNPIDKSIKYLKIPVTDGLIAHYDALSVQSGKIKEYILKDLVGNNDASIMGPQLNVMDNYFFGSRDTTIYFPPTILPPIYTLFTLAKYNGPNTKKIFGAKNRNAYFGFDLNGVVGVAHNGSQHISKQTSGIPQDLWILSTNDDTTYRVNFTDNTNVNEIIRNITYPLNLIINIPQNEQFGSIYNSDFAIRCILVFNRKMTLDEIQNVENWIVYTYGFN